MGLATIMRHTWFALNVVNQSMLKRKTPPTHDRIARMEFTRRNFILALMALPAAAALSGPLGKVLAQRPAYHSFGADFDGSTDYLTRGGGLLGTADGRSFIFSAWLKKKPFGGVEIIKVESKEYIPPPASEWLTIRVGG